MARNDNRKWWLLGGALGVGWLMTRSKDAPARSPGYEAPTAPTLCSQAIDRLAASNPQLGASARIAMANRPIPGNRELNAVTANEIDLLAEQLAAAKADSYLVGCLRSKAMEVRNA